MYYILAALLSLLIPFVGYRSRAHELFAKNETIVSYQPLGKIRSCIFAVSLVVSIAYDFLTVFFAWIDLYPDSVHLMYTPITSVYAIGYGSEAGSVVLFVLASKLVFLCAISVLRGTALYLCVKYVMGSNCTEYKYVKRMPLIILLMLAFQILVYAITYAENSVVLKYTGITGENPDISVTYYVTWLIAFWNLCIEHHKNHTYTSSEVTATKPKHHPKKPKSKLNHNQPRFYKTYRTSQYGLNYTMNEFLYSALHGKSINENHNYIEELEMFITASDAYATLFSHIFILITIFNGHSSWSSIVLAITFGYFIGTLLSHSAVFTIYNITLNYATIPYNFLQRLFLVDVIIFALYVFFVKSWWLILVHVITFTILIIVCARLFTKTRTVAINNLALHYLPELKYEETEATEVTINPEPLHESDSTSQIITDSIPKTQKNTAASPDEARLAELEAELKKFPVNKIKRWHTDGKITDEQYKAIARKYNSIKKEIEEIKERMGVLKNIE